MSSVSEDDAMPLRHAARASNKNINFKVRKK
jgi:hypothetical protein